MPLFRRPLARFLSRALSAGGGNVTKRAVTCARWRQEPTSLRRQRRRAAPAAGLHLQTLLTADRKALQQVVDHKEGVVGRVQQHAALGPV